jgi:predicted ATPase
LSKRPFALIFNCRYKDNGDKYDFGFSRQKRICLKILNKSEFRELVKDRLKIKTVPRDTLNVLDEKSRRNPLYLEQTAIYVRENSILDKKNRIKDRSSLPTGINQIILARIDKLHSEMKDILKTASCIGNEIPADLLSFLFRNKYDSISKYLTELEQEDILILFSEMSYLFKYGVIRDVIYEMQLKKTVRMTHEVIGETLEIIHKGNLGKYYSILSYHYENAENVEKALFYHEKAGCQAKDNYQNDQALYHFDKANHFISVRNGIGEDEWINKCSELEASEVKKYIELNFKRLHFYYTFRQNMQSSNKIIETIQSLSEKIGDELLFAMSNLEKSLILTQHGKYEESISILKDSITKFRKHNLFDKVSLYQLSVGKNYFMSGRLDEALHSYQEALENSENITDGYERDKMKAKIYGDMGIANDYSGNMEKALEYYNKQLALTEKLNLKVEKALAIGNIGIIFHLNGDLNKAKEYYEEKLKISDELGRKLDMAQILNNMGFLYKDLNDFTKSVKYHKKSIALSKEMSDFSTMSNAYINLGHTYRAMCDFARSEQNFLKGISLAEEYKLKHSYAEGTIELADLYMQQNNKNLSLKYIHLGLEAAKEAGYTEYIEKGTGIFEKINPK